MSISGIQHGDRAMVLGTRHELISRAQQLPRDSDRALAFPLGGSTFRVVLINRAGRIVDEFELAEPARYYDDLMHATAAAQVFFGCRPAVAAAFLAGPVPRRGLLKFTNLKGWQAFDRNESRALFGYATDWLNDGQAGYYGLSLLNQEDFAQLRPGSFQEGDAYGYAIFGSGLNMGLGLVPREDGHPPFAPRGRLETAFQQYLRELLGYYPDLEEACSGDYAFRYAARFFMGELTATKLQYDPFVQVFESVPEKQQGKVVTRFALETDNQIARSATRLVFGNLGTFLGSHAVASVLQRIDVSCGILSNPDLRRFCIKESDFLYNFEHQGRELFSDMARGCTVRVCLHNPEHHGAVARATQLLQAIT